MILRVQVGSGVHGTSVSGQDDRDEMGLCHDTRRFERPAAEATRPGPSPIVGCDDGPPLGGLLFPLFRYWLLKGPWITLAPRGMAFDHRHGGISRSSVCLLASGGRG
jgi:hypothetical protein